MIESSMAMASPESYVYQMEAESYDSLLERITFGEAACMQLTPPVPADLSGFPCTEPPRLRHPDDMPMLSCAERSCTDAFANDAYPTWHYYSPLPFASPFGGGYDYSYEPAFIRKRNERERQRVKCVNEGYAQLRQHLPQELTDKRLSKVETLRAAIKYIRELQALLAVHAEHAEHQPPADAVSQATDALETAAHGAVSGDGASKRQIRH
ncbi:achaete-scute homolog 3-like [Chiloscyllium plagiosum]|uniref:achaete-scute homolog 3-like n=1 Tax=Chiloscyllium plagiosum TaxID=36176 RepID=UPI001CB7D583|nr:achaete-scute homolog 3-like [Chiloscyllium plagiosum]